LYVDFPSAPVILRSLLLAVLTTEIEFIIGDALVLFRRLRPLLSRIFSEHIMATQPDGNGTAEYPHLHPWPAVHQRFGLEFGCGVFSHGTLEQIRGEHPAHDHGPH